jgi:hypothetical protein
MTMKTFSLILLVLATLAMLPSTAGAETYINGKQIRGVTNLTLENCSVTFNSRGDVYINAPGYNVAPTAAMGSNAGTANSSVSLLSSRYFLFVQTNRPGVIPVDFEILVDGKAIKTVTASDAQLVQEMTIFFKPGTNKLTIRALPTNRPASSAADTFSIVVGKGSPNQGSLEIEKVLLTYTRTGADMELSVDSYDLEIQ